MNKLEYIPGDLVSVYVGVKKYIVEVIGAENENEVLSYQIKFPNGEIQYADKDNIVPIPLTLEILEKNGWVKDTHRHCLDEKPAEAYEKKDFPLTHFNVTFGKKRIQASHDCLFVRNLKYVSDLQHLLFGLGLNSEMEVYV